MNPQDADRRGAEALLQDEGARRGIAQGFAQHLAEFENTDAAVAQRVDEGVVFLAGLPLSRKGTTNVIRVETVV